MVKRLTLNAKIWVAGIALRLLLVPFLALQLVAPGTMAEAGPDGLRMVLCSDGQVVEVVLAPDGTLTPVDGTDSDSHAGSICPWSLTIDLAAHPHRPGAETTANSLIDTRHLLAPHAPYTGTLFLRPHSRAPPSRA